MGKKYTTLLLFFLFFSLPVFALEINYPPLPGGIQPPQEFLKTATPEQILPLYANYIFNFAIWISGTIAFLFFLYGGIRYLVSSGKPDAITSAKSQTTNALLGLLILFSSFLLLKTLNPQFISVKPFKIPEVKPINFDRYQPSDLKSTATSINAEIPIGRIIEGRIFESYVEPEEKREPGFEKPRLKRITENADKTLKIAEDLQRQNQLLAETVLGMEIEREDSLTSYLSAFPNYNYFQKEIPKQGIKVGLESKILLPSTAPGVHTFWCDCDYSSTDINKNIEKCGKWSSQSMGLTAKSSCVYKKEGVFVPKVIIQGQDGQTESLATVTLSKEKNSDPLSTASPYYEVGENMSISLTGNGSDQESQITGKWLCSGGSLSSARALSPIFTAPLVTKNTEYNCVLTVFDNKGAYSSAISKIKVLNKIENKKGCKCSNKTDNGDQPSPYCPNPLCLPLVPIQPVRPDCVCDPCLPQTRLQIQLIQQQNLTKIDELRKEQEKTDKEIKLLATELNKLEKTANFLRQCRYGLSNTFTQYLIQKNTFEGAEKSGKITGSMREINLWEDINNTYYSQIEKKQTNDWATFTCTVGGTALTTPPFIEEEEKELIEPIFGEDVSDITKACTTEAPVGEIIERAKRIGYSLIERLSKLSDLNKKTIEAVDKMHRVISQCTSQGIILDYPSQAFCWTVCDPIFCSPVACVGPYQQSSPDITQKMLDNIVKNTKADCENSCTIRGFLNESCFKNCFKGDFIERAIRSNEAPCPYITGELTGETGPGPLIQSKEINRLVFGNKKNLTDNIKEEGIEDIIYGYKREENPVLEINGESSKIKLNWTMGSNRIVDEIIPRTLDDLQKKVRHPLQSCETQSNGKIFYLCSLALGEVSPDGTLIRACGLDQPVFQQCLEKCYLGREQNRFRECLQGCLNEKSKEFKEEEISQLRHLLNSYCCEQ